MGARLTIDLEAVANNYRLLDRTSGSASCAAVVKANAYGLGIDRVAPALHAAGCRAFFVATFDEAVELRSLLNTRRLDAEIFVLNGAPSRFAGDSYAERLIPILNTEADVVGWNDAGASAARKPVVGVHFDTAMSRLGLATSEAVKFLDDRSAWADLEVVALLSHLACADEPEHPLNRDQLARFSELCRAVPGIRASLANSSGVFLGPEFRFDMVRVGVALYGANPTPDRSNPMSEVINLKGKIAQIRQIDSGMTVGYGAAFQAVRPMRLATVPVGYADGYPRALGNQGFGEIHGIRVPVVGRVSMDLTVFDVTDVAPEIADVGEDIQLIGGTVALDDVADAADTIAYEILVRLGQRFDRTYVNGTGSE